MEDNINRWKGQFQPPEGKSLDDLTKVEELEGKDGFTTTFLEVEGTFVAAVRPGAPEKHNKPEHAMLGAVVIGPGGPYFFKGLGPKQTLDLWREPFRAMIDSFGKSGGNKAGDKAGDKPDGGDAKPDGGDAEPKGDAKADAKPEDKPDDAKAPAK